MEKIWTEGVILKMGNQGEADQFLTLFTKDFGKFEILAKSIRKIASKLRSGIELFYLSKLCFVQGKSFKILTDVILLEKFKNIRDDLKKLDIVYKILETTDSLIKDEEKDEVI